MFNKLQDNLNNAIHQLKGYGKITEINIAQTIKEIRRALIDSDVSFKIAKDFTLKVKEKAIGQNVLNTINPRQLIIKILHDELVNLMGIKQVEINISDKISIILIAGLQGSGKTTFSGKLANYLKIKKLKNPLLVACDVYRPGAINQLKVLGEQIDVAVYTEFENKNPVVISKNAIQFAKKNNYNVIIVDTAGRLSIDEVMMNEIKTIHQEIQPSETLFVVDAMTGQDAVNTVKVFNDVLDFNGVVLTKLDGDTRGGVALTIKYVINKPIKFISIGEKMDSLDLFYPKRMADRILGMGDVISLVEKAQEHFNQKELKKIEKKILKNQFGFDDFLIQIKQIKRMGNIKDLIAMIPGIRKSIKDLNISDDSFKNIESIIYSMTPKERRNPKYLLNQSRKIRIAKGSGKTLQEVNQVLKKFEHISKIMKNIKNLSGKGILDEILKKVKIN